MPATSTTAAEGVKPNENARVGASEKIKGSRRALTVGAA
jgi:hypothetical protein